MTTRPYVNPEELTEQERERRIIELLAIASVRMAREQIAGQPVAPSEQREFGGTPQIEPTL